MDLEARSLQPSLKASFLTKLREYKYDLTNLKREVKKALTVDFQSAREDLLESGMNDTLKASADQRERLLMSTEWLNQSTDRIKERRRTMLETEDLGVSILQDLHQQCQGLLHAHDTIAEDYSHCRFLLRLPGYYPMSAFRDVIDVPLVVRKAQRSRQEVRKELGICEDAKVVIFNFGGQQASWVLKEESLPPGRICLVYAASPKQEFPSNFRRLKSNVYTPDLISACDCMLGKIGYGTVSEALSYKIPFVFVRRDYFNEAPFLRNMLEYYQGGVERIKRDLLTGHWIPYLERALKLKPCYDLPVNGGEVAASILQSTAIGKAFTSDKQSGARRLRDAIILGFQLQRISGRDICIPEWYSHAEKDL